MNSKTAGIFFLFVCLFIVLFIGQWTNSRGVANSSYLGQMESFTEGKVGRTTHHKTTHPKTTHHKTTHHNTTHHKTTHPKTTYPTTIATTKKSIGFGAPNPVQTTRKIERFSNRESFKEGAKAKGKAKK